MLPAVLGRSRPLSERDVSSSLPLLSMLCGVGSITPGGLRWDDTAAAPVAPRKVDNAPLLSRDDMVRLVYAPVDLGVTERGEAFVLEACSASRCWPRRAPSTFVADRTARSSLDRSPAFTVL